MRLLMVPKTHNANSNDLAEAMYHELTHDVGGTQDLPTTSTRACKVIVIESVEH